MLATLLLDPYRELTKINSWLYPNNLLHYVYLVFQRENAAGVVLLLQAAVIGIYCIRGILCHRSL